jgi:hypothetical protein
MSLSLAEEYLKRHSIADVPLVKHIKQGTLFMKEESVFGTEWGLMTINYVQDGHGPGVYQMRHLKPHHDGYLHRGGMFEMVASDNLEWDQYEDYIWELVKRPGRPRAIRDHKEIMLTAWEMFLHCCDTGLVPHANNETLFRSIDRELTVPERHVHFSLFSSHLHKAEPTLFDLWNREFVTHVRGNCHWLAQLMETNGGD